MSDEFGAEEGGGTPFAMISVALGVVGLLSACVSSGCGFMGGACGFCSIPLPMVFALGAVGTGYMAYTSEDPPSGMAKAGLALGVLDLILGVVGVIAGCMAQGMLQGVFALLSNM